VGNLIFILGVEEFLRQEKALIPFREKIPDWLDVEQACKIFDEIKNLSAEVRFEKTLQA
jgi:hypothetical protein